MQGVPSEKLSSSQCQNGGGGREERGKEKQGKCSRKASGEKTLQGAVGWVRGWKSCHTGGGAQQSLLTENQVCGKGGQESRYRSGLWGLCRPW